MTNKKIYKLIDGTYYLVQTTSRYLEKFLKNLNILLFILVLLFVLLFFVNKYYLGFFVLRSTSMFPNFRKGDIVVVSKNYGILYPGDIVAFKKDGTILLKRIIACSGEKILFKTGTIITDTCIFKSVFDIHNKKKEPIEVMYCKKLNKRLSYKIIPTKYTLRLAKLSKGFFVMGDNRANSLDSREFGTISNEDIIGRFLYKY